MTVHPTAAVVFLVLLCLLVGAVALFTVVTVRDRRGGAGRQPNASAGRRPVSRAALIVNPTKVSDVQDARSRVTAVCREHGWDEPLWLTTTAQDPGRGQTRQALAQRVDLVCTLGGDGTVREVAETLVGTGVPLGLLPGGTGNLLARNLELPLTGIEDALAVALDGVDRMIDVGRVRFTGSSDRAGSASRERVFLVAAGLGFDAAMMAGAPERLKAQVGWLAYVVSGARNLRGPRARARIKLDDAQPFSRRVRSVLVANCGTLTGGIVLLPQARVDDGWLDAMTLSPAGAVSWVTVATRVLLRRGHHPQEQARCRELAVRVDRSTPAQVDGDLVGEVRGMRARIDPGALAVRVPRGQSRSR
ncbi:MAG: diacylglycerol/lipid kinase family protein [Angustibacter sp.]